MGAAAGMRIAAVGDVIPLRPLGPDAELPAGVQAALRELRAADVAFGTLEAPLTDRGEPWAKVVSYRADPARADDVAAMGFDLVSLANNQTMNYGLAGLRQTIELLDARGVRHVGAGMDAEQAWAPAVFEAGGVRAAFVACTCVAPLGWAATAERAGLAALRVRTAYEVDARWDQEEPGVAPRVRTWLDAHELDRAREAVARAARLADVVVASVHWGVGASAERAGYQEQLGRALAAAGADCVLGGHPPFLQGFELHGEALVSYSQGTFVRQQPRATGDPALAALYDAMPRGGCLLRLRAAPDGALSAELLPTRLGERELAALADGSEAGAIRAEIVGRSTAEDGRMTVRDGALEVRIRRPHGPLG